MKTAILCSSQAMVDKVYSKEVLSAINELSPLSEKVYTKDDVKASPKDFADTEFLFSTWGMPVFSEEEIKEYLPSLKCVFYAAGSVQAFARPFLNCAVKVFSAWAANAVPVAEYTVSQIILANKGFYSRSRIMKSGDTQTAFRLADSYRGNYGASVGLIGCGMIGTLVAKMLRAYKLEVKVFDPFLSKEKAESLGVIPCSLEELFSTCTVVSNHLANNEKTVNMLGGKLFSSMLPYATFLNTGRGAQVVESELCEVLEKRPDLSAVLDVTYPEPPQPGHPFYSLDNCVLTPHIAGSQKDECFRMAEYVKDEFAAYLAGKPTSYEVSLKLLETMA